MVQTEKMITKKDPLILASASPRRKMLLTGIGLPFRVVVSNVQEDCPFDEPARMTMSLAERKALDVYGEDKPLWILGADTLVVVNGTVLGKPRSKNDAIEMLSLLSGRKHMVVTGFCILNPFGIVAHSEAVKTDVFIKKLGSDEIKNYINTGEPFDKAGAYAIQGIGSFMVKSISGSYTNVVGLPIPEVIDALVSLRAIKHFPLSP